MGIPFPVKEESMGDHDEGSIAHMSMVQGIIARLETNCFTLKAVVMALAGGLLAFLASLESSDWVYPLAGGVPMVVFWLMDAMYLRMGRAFRALFEEIRLGELKEPFSMDIRPHLRRGQSVIRVALSWSIFWYYASILAAFVGVAVYFFLSNS